MKSENPNRSRLVLGVILGLSAICVGFGVWVSRLRGDLADGRKETARLRAQVEAAGHEPASPGRASRPTPDKSTGPLGSSAAAAPGSAAASDPPKTDAKRRVNPEEMSALLKSPMMQKIMASQTSTVLQMTYGHLMDRLQLSPEERDYLQRLLVEKQTNLQNLGMQFLNPGISSDERTALQKQLEAAWTTGETKIREFLNDEADFAYYETYNRQEPERTEVGFFEASLGGADVLTPATSDALATLQHETRKEFPFTVDFYDQKNYGNTKALNTTAVNKFLDEQKEFQSQVAAKAADLLTPAQLQLFKQNQATLRQMTGMRLNSIVQMAGGAQ